MLAKFYKYLKVKYKRSMSRDNKSPVPKRIVVVCLISILCSSIFLGAMRSKMDAMFFYELSHTMMEITRQDKYLVKEKINSCLISMNIIANYISLYGINKYNYETYPLKEQLGSYGVSATGVLDKDGRIVNGTPIALKNDSILKSVLQGKNEVCYIQDESILGADYKNSIILMVPIYENKQVVGVLYGIYPGDAIKNVFAKDFFKGEGDSFVIDKDGNILLEPNKAEYGEEFSEIFHKKWESGTEHADSDEAVAIIQQLKTAGEGYGKYSFSDGREIYVSTQQLFPNAQVYVISIISSEIVQNSMNEILNNMTMVLSVMLIILFGAYVRIEYINELHQKKMYELAYLNKVTKLGNMSLLTKDLIKRFNKGENIDHFIVSMDINKMKTINEAMGFPYGTEIIRTVSEQLVKQMAGGERCYHAGSDHFYLLMRALNHDADLKRVKEMLVRITAFFQENYQHTLTFTCGINYFNLSKCELDELALICDNADLVRKRNKGEIKNSINEFDEAILNRLKEEREIEDAFLPAIHKGEFIMYYQPKYIITGEKPVLGGAEALVRWISSTKGFMNPGRFIPLFERDGNAVTLDMHIMELVCKQVHSWLEEGHKVVPVSVNVSRQTLLQGMAFIEEVERLLGVYSVPKELIEMEVLENAVGTNEELMVEFLNEIHNRGFKIAMDDFGRGYSSLGIIDRMPLNYLKLDKSFFDVWTEHPTDFRMESGLVKRTIQLAQDRNIIIVAEGIEQEFQVNRLKEFGCDMIQGYYFSKPLTPDDFVKKLDNREFS